MFSLLLSLFAMPCGGILVKIFCARLFTTSSYTSVPFGAFGASGGLAGIEDGTLGFLITDDWFGDCLIMQLILWQCTLFLLKPVYQ